MQPSGFGPDPRSQQRTADVGGRSGLRQNALWPLISLRNTFI